MFDLAGTTVRDESYVARFLHRAARDVGLEVSEEEIGRNIGTNKRDLYKLRIVRSRGLDVSLERIGTIDVAEEDARFADEVYQIYEQYMLELYRSKIQEVLGASDIFGSLYERGVKVPLTPVSTSRSIKPSWKAWAGCATVWSTSRWTCKTFPTRAGL
jgi:beta-phosphoglucomutase-like phosphatase (HAD superfamily)